MMKKILMVCYGGGHVKIIAPLYHVLQKSFDVKILALTSAIPYLRSLSIPFLTFNSFIDYLDSDVTVYGKKLVENLPCDNRLDYEESVAYLGASFHDLVITHGLDEAYKLYERSGRTIFFPTLTLQCIFDKIKPDLLITTNAPRSERAALHVAKINNVKSICINDNLWVSGGVDDVVLKELANSVCVLSSSVKSKLIKINPSVDIFVTGTPVFDPLKILREKKINPRPIILLADCELPAEHPLYPGVKADPNLGHNLRNELNSLAKSESWRIIFRPHPSQNERYEEFDNIEISSSLDSLHALLPQVDVVITAISTVGIEGLLCGAGLVSIENTVYGATNSYYEYGLSTPVYSSKDLKDAIMLEVKSSQCKPLELYEGNSTDNILKVINNLIRL